MKRSGAGLLFALASFGATAQTDGEQLYMQIHSVLTHPRCLNCHPTGNSPKQGNEARVHAPPMVRGVKDEGPPGMPCSSCHQEKNVAASGVPGAPNWHLAPLSMGWEGRTPGEVCRQLLDRKRNGDKSLQQIVHHMTDDELVGWGWAPGTDVSGKEREPVPIAKDEFRRIVNAWAQAGAPCPK